MPLKIVFMGTPEFSAPTLQALIKNEFNILGVYTQPPKKSKRGQKINASPIEELSKKNNEKITYEEGCLSVPNQFAEIDRPSKCEVEYLDYNGHKQNLQAEGLLATCIQHEIDHLEGILFIDYLSKLKKAIIVKKLSKQQIKPDRIIV